MNYPPITWKLLKKKDACKPQVLLLKKEFNKKKIHLTDENAIKYAKVFDFHWAAGNLLTDGDIDEYLKVITPAWAEYEKVRNIARAGYVKVRAFALAEYVKVCDIAYAEYVKVCDIAYAEYVKVCDPALAEYDKVCALAFVRIYRKGMKKAA